MSNTKLLNIPDVDMRNVDLYYTVLVDSDNVKYLDLNTLIIRGVANRYKGVGTQVLNYILKFAQVSECGYITLKADTKQRQVEGFVLVDWYKKFGFIELGIDGYFMKMVKYLCDVVI